MTTWISLTERLPEENREVLVFIDYGWKGGERCYLYAVSRLLNPNGVFSVPVGSPVTHWMPLPEPPRVPSNDKPLAQPEMKYERTGVLDNGGEDHA